MSEDSSGFIDNLRGKVLIHEAHQFVAETPKSAKIKAWVEVVKKVLRLENEKEKPDDKKIEQAEAVMSLLSLQHSTLRQGQEPLREMSIIHPRMEEWLVGVEKLPVASLNSESKALNTMVNFINKRGEFAAEVDRFRIMREDPAAELITEIGGQLKQMRTEQRRKSKNLDILSKGSGAGVLNVERMHDTMVWELNKLEDRIDAAEAVQSGISLYLADKYMNTDGPDFNHPRKDEWKELVVEFVQKFTHLDERAKETALRKFIEDNGKLAREIDDAHSLWEHQDK